MHELSGDCLLGCARIMRGGRFCCWRRYQESIPQGCVGHSLWCFTWSEHCTPLCGMCVSWCEHNDWIIYPSDASHVSFFLWCYCGIFVLYSLLIFLMSPILFVYHYLFSGSCIRSVGTLMKLYQVGRMFSTLHIWMRFAILVVSHSWYNTIYLASFQIRNHFQLNVCLLLTTYRIEQCGWMRWMLVLLVVDILHILHVASWNQFAEEVQIEWSGSKS